MFASEKADAEKIGKVRPLFLARIAGRTRLILHKYIIRLRQNFMVPRLVFQSCEAVSDLAGAAARSWLSGRRISLKITESHNAPMTTKRLRSKGHKRRAQVIRLLLHVAEKSAHFSDILDIGYIRCLILMSHEDMLYLYQRSSRVTVGIIVVEPIFALRGSRFKRIGCSRCG